MSTFLGIELIQFGDIPLRSIVEGVVLELGWSIIESEETLFKIKEKDRFDYYNPLEMEIEMLPYNKSSVELKVQAKNAGYGPVQDEYIKSQVIRFIDAVKRATHGDDEDISSREGEIDHSIAIELERVAKLHVEGELTDEEFRKAKERILMK